MSDYDGIGEAFYSVFKAMVATIITLTIIIICLLIPWKKANAHGYVPSTEDAADFFSDVGLVSAIAYPYAYALSEDTLKFKRITTAASMHLLNGAMTEAIKTVTKRERPDKSDKKSFPSGHTSTAFTSAGLICAQTNRHHCYIATALAGTVGYLRVLAKKHHWSDIAAGMALGVFNGYRGPVFYPSLVWRF